MSAYSESFSLKVEHATFLPDEAAMREFVEQLNAALESDSALAKKYETDPTAVLADRGVSADIRRELLVASGLSGAADDSCWITCIITTWNCGQTIVITL